MALPLTIKVSTFPEECKTTKLNSIFKKGARTGPKNCPPISLLPPVSKIIEKSIKFQIEDYLNRKKTNPYVSVTLQDEPFNKLLSDSVDRPYFNWNWFPDICI